MAEILIAQSNKILKPLWIFNTGDRDINVFIFCLYPYKKLFIRIVGNVFCPCPTMERLIKRNWNMIHCGNPNTT